MSDDYVAHLRRESKGASPGHFAAEIRRTPTRQAELDLLVPHLELELEKLVADGYVSLEKVKEVVTR